MKSNVLHTEAHPDCVVCGLQNPIGLKLDFEIDGEAVVIEWRLSELFQGYPGIAHGGVIATLLDAAMTHCLFARGVKAVTGDLRIRYRKPVPVGRTVAVRASVKDESPPLYVLVAELKQDGETLVTAEARFMQIDEV